MIMVERVTIKLVVPGSAGGGVGMGVAVGRGVLVGDDSSVWREENEDSA